QVTGLAQKTLHAPLSTYLEGLKCRSDPYLVYQAAYASQALQYVPDNETLLQAVLRRAGILLGGTAKTVSAIKAFDLNSFIEGLRRIQEGLAGASEVINIIKEGYEGVMSLAESGQNFLECLKEGFSFTRKSAWYPALRIMDTLLQNGQLADFKHLVRISDHRDRLFQHRDRSLVRPAKAGMFSRS
ncbi:hypothetical protein BGZ97_007364, partial [Linnemannia gamsii]